MRGQFISPIQFIRGLIEGFIYLLGVTLGTQLALEETQLQVAVVLGLILFLVSLLSLASAKKGELKKAFVEFLVALIIVLAFMFVFFYGGMQVLESIFQGVSP